VTSSYSLEYRGLDEDGLKRLLCDEKGFSEERVDKLIERMKGFYASRAQAKLIDWA